MSGKIYSAVNPRIEGDSKRKFKFWEPAETARAGPNLAVFQTLQPNKVRIDLGAPKSKNFYYGFELFSASLSIFIVQSKTIGRCQSSQLCRSDHKYCLNATKRVAVLHRLMKQSKSNQKSRKSANTVAFVPDIRNTIRIYYRIIQKCVQGNQTCISKSGYIKHGQGEWIKYMHLISLLCKNVIQTSQTSISSSGFIRFIYTISWSDQNLSYVYIKEHLSIGH